MSETSRPRVLIVQSAYRPEIVADLARGATAALADASATIETVTASGALEIPGIIAMAARAGRFDAYVALGCILKGETIHDDVVARACFDAIMSLTVDHHLAIGNGVMTVNTLAQAQERADPARQNRGAEAATAALSLLSAKRRFDPALTGK